MSKQKAKPRVLGIIPARGGSKRIPNKNIIPFLGKPLIYYIIQAAKGAKLLDKVIISTDSPKIAKIAKEYGVAVPFLRPKKFAQDKTPDLPVFQHAIKELEKQGEKFDFVVNLRPTAPMVRAKDIDKAIDLLIKSKTDSVRSMNEVTHPPYWMKVVDKKGQAHSFIPGKDDTTYPTMKHVPHKTYQLNGQVDVMKTSWIKKGKLYGNKMSAYIIDPNRVVDIDIPIDIKIAEVVMANELSKKIKLKIGSQFPAFIIAEVGVNHDGNLKKAFSLVDLAKSAGADAIKFQTFKPNKLLLVDAEKPAYQKKNVAQDSQYKMLSKLMLSEEEHEKLFRYCQQKEIIFLSTPYDEESADFLDKLGVPAFKLASIEVVSHPFLDFISKKKKPIILSTGLSDEKEIDDAVAIFEKNQALKRLILLHCHADYPTKDTDANLLKIKALQNKFPDIIIGYSDHTTNLLSPTLAVALGAKVIEKHFTWDKKANGPDHQASANVTELKLIVENIRKVETLFGKSNLQRTKSEQKNLLMRKSLVSAYDIPKSIKITNKMITYKRPGSGLWPTFENIKNIVGKKAKFNIKKDTLLRKSMFK